MFSSKYSRWNRGCFLSYTIYPDELFVTNLVMDYYLLRLVKKLCGGRAGVLASLGGAAFGALSYCMLILLPVSFPANTLLAYVAINTALQYVEQTGNMPVPLHLRNAPTKLMEQMGYGCGYKYAHDYPGNFVRQKFMPEKSGNPQFWNAADNAQEAKMKQRMDALWGEWRQQQGE